MAEKKFYIKDFVHFLEVSENLDNILADLNLIGDRWVQRTTGNFAKLTGFERYKELIKVIKRMLIGEKSLVTSAREFRILFDNMIGDEVETEDGTFGEVLFSLGRSHIPQEKTKPLPKKYRYRQQDFNDGLSVNYQTGDGKKYGVHEEPEEIGNELSISFNDYDNYNLTFRDREHFANHGFMKSMLIEEKLFKDLFDAWRKKVDLILKSRPRPSDDDTPELESVKSADNQLFINCFLPMSSTELPDGIRNQKDYELAKEGIEPLLYTYDYHQGMGQLNKQKNGRGIISVSHAGVSFEGDELTCEEYSKLQDGRLGIVNNIQSGKKGEHTNYLTENEKFKQEQKKVEFFGSYKKGN